MATSFNIRYNEFDWRRNRSEADIPIAEPDGVVKEGALETDEWVVERNMSLDPPFVLSFDAADREGVECVRRALEQCGAEVISGTEPVFEGEDTIVDVVDGG